MNNGWQPLATFDLAKLDCRVVPGAWNQIRVAAEGRRFASGSIACTRRPIRMRGCAWK